MAKYYGFLLGILFSFSTFISHACDGMSANVISNEYIGNGIYQLTVQFCEVPSNGAGTYGVYGVLVQVNGGATITGTNTPSFTSNANGSIINFNQINATSAEWGNWDNDPAMTDIFIPNGSPSQCITMVLLTDGPATSVNIAGSSHNINLGAGFVSVTLPGQVQRFACYMTNLPVPPVVCSSSWTPPSICPNSTQPVDLNTTTSATGTFSGPGVNSATGILDPTGLTFPISVTFMVGDAGFNCSTTHEIDNFSIDLNMEDESICEGESVQLDASLSNLPCEYTLRLTDSGNNGWTCGANVRVFVNGVQVGGNHSVPTSGANQSDYTLTFPVNDGDIITLQYTPGSGLLCSSNNNQNTIQILNAQGNQVFSQSNPSGGMQGSGLTVNCNHPNYTYSWSPTTGLSNPSIANPIASPTQTTNYTVTIGLPAQGCSFVYDVTVNVSDGTLPIFTLPTTFCQNEAAPILPTTSNNGIAGSWFPATISTSTPGNQQYTFTPTNGACTTPTVLSVTVNPLLTPTFDALNPLCQNDQVPVLPTTSTNGVSGTWSGTVNSQNTGNFTLTFTPATNQCATNTTLSYTVNELPVINAGIDQEICAGESVTLTATGGVSYSWTGGVTNGNSFSPTTTTTYTVTGTGLNGCQASDIVLVVVNPLPTINAGADLDICSGQAVTLTATGQGTFSWSGGVVNGESFIPTSTVTYTVTTTDVNGCVNSDEITVTVTQTPIADVSADVQSGFPGLTVNYSNNSTNATNYTWDFGNGITLPSNTTSGQTISYNQPGVYVIELTAINGSCTDTDTIHVTVYKFPDVIIYVPNVTTLDGNGVNDTWFIDTKNAKTVFVQIFNRWGNLMAEFDDVNDKWNGEVDGKKVSEGVYFYKYVITDLSDQEHTGHGHFTVISK